MKLRILAATAVTIFAPIGATPAFAESADAGVYAAVECGDDRWRIRGYGSYEACYYAAAAYYDGNTGGGGGGVGDGPGGGGGGGGGGDTPGDIRPGIPQTHCGSRISCTPSPAG